MLIRLKPHNHTRPRIIAALDIGSTKIACFISEVSSEGEIRIIGIGHQLSRGIRSGIITDIVEAENSIVAAVHAAEQMAGTTIDDVVVNISGGQLVSRHVTVELAVAGEGVSERDIADIIQEGCGSVRCSDYQLIHYFPVSYFLDGMRGIKDPRGMYGKQLGGELHILTAPDNIIRNLSGCLAHCHLDVRELVVPSHAAALSSLEPDEMDLGATLIDMGGGVTSFSVYTGGKNVYTDAIPMGGQHVTNDIAKGLSTSLVNAERLKTLHGSAISSPQDEQAMIDVPQLGEEDEADEGNLMPRSMLVGIVRPRLEEIFEIIRGKLEGSGLGNVAGRRVVLTGGASQLMGVRDLSARVLGKQVRLGKPRTVPGLADAVSGPAFACAIGMLQFAVRKHWEDQLVKPQSGLQLSDRMQKIAGWFKSNF